MTPRGSRLVAGDRRVAVARRSAAVAHWEAAEDLAANGNDAKSIVSLYILAGIAASDAICCTKLGEYSSSDNHIDAVEVLRRAAPDLAAPLKRLLSRKTEANYGVDEMGATRVTEARTAAGNLVEAARRA